MKTILKFLFTYCFIFQASYMNAQWEIQNSGITDDLQAVQYASSDQIYAGGAYGLLMRSTDAGSSWHEISAPAFSGYVSDLKFVNQDTGYVHGWGQIFKTYDGGDSWSWVYTAPSWHYFAMGIWDEDHITIAGRMQINPNEYWTTNSGPSGWKGGVYPGSNSGTQYHDMQYISADTVLALRFNGISMSTDGGDNWTYTSNNGQIAENAGWNEFFFINSRIGYVGASNYSTGGGVVYKTVDGGQTYTNVGATADGIRAIHFINEEVGFVGCEGGFIYKTIDGGETWYGEQHGISTIKDIDFLDENHGVFVNEAGEIYTTTNGGNQVPDARDAALLETNLHYILNSESAPYEIKAIIRNEGIESLSSVVLNYQINDNEVQSATLNNLNLPNLVSREVSHPIQWSPDPGEYRFNLWLDQPNDLDDQDGANDSISFYITVFEKPLNNRNVLAEDATGAWCGWCPGVAITFDTLSSWYNTSDRHRFIPVAQHNGDILTTAESDEYALLWSGGAFPSSWFDRFRFFGNTVVKLGFEDDVVERIEERFAMDAPVDLDIDIDFNEITRVLDVEVTAHFNSRVEGDFRMNCWLLENGLLTNQSNFFDDISGHPYEGAGDPIVDYVNNHVLRFTLSELWGDSGLLPSAVEAGSQYSKSYSIDVPENYDVEALDVVAFISEYSDKIDRRTILNAQYETVSDMVLSNHEIEDSSFDLSVYPNPTSDWANIYYQLKDPAKVEIKVVNSFGNVLESLSFNGVQGMNSAQVDLKEYSPGIYFIKICSHNVGRAIKVIVE